MLKIFFSIDDENTVHRVIGNKMIRKERVEQSGLMNLLAIWVKDRYTLEQIGI